MLRAARVLVTTLALAISVAIVPDPALPAGSTVPASSAGSFVTSIGTDTLKPASCAAITLTTVTAASNGTGADELLLGTAAADTMTAGAGNDCVLGGAGDDSIDGGPGTDICIGGPGTDTFTNCETQIQ
jgi:Ca2+-binding RTX toxin-like protein